MTRAVYIGGLNGGNSSIERVAKALEDYYDDIDAFKFSDLHSQPDTIRRATSDRVKAGLVTHSAGALALGRFDLVAGIDEVHLLNPPLKQKVRDLLAKTVTKTVRMNAGIHNLEDARAVGAYTASTAAEFAAHPIGNFGQLAEIARTDSVKLIRPVVDNHIPTTMVWTTEDAYFRPSDLVLARARLNGVRVIDDIAGEHDEVLLHPEQFLAQVFEHSQI